MTRRSRTDRLPEKSTRRLSPFALVGGIVVVAGFVGLGAYVAFRTHAKPSLPQEAVAVLQAKPTPPIRSASEDAPIHLVPAEMPGAAKLFVMILIDDAVRSAHQH